MKKKLVPKDRTYKLVSGASPLSFIIPTRNTSSFPLLWFDEEQNVNRPLRYAVNQKSPFEDEQDGEAIVRPIAFENGTLFVPKNNPVLYQFLDLHPMNGIVFEEVDLERDAKAELDNMNLEVDALIAAKELSIEELESVGRVLFQHSVQTMTTAELKRDVLIYARGYPEEFLDMLQDPDMDTQSQVHIFFDAGLLSFRKSNKEVWYSTPTNKKKMLNVPHGEDPYYMVTQFFKTDDGIEALKMLEHHMDSE